MAVASVQPPMSATVEGNLATILHFAAEAAAADASLVLFPELALTGFHRGLREVAVRSTVDAAVARLHAELPVPALVGTPWWVGDDVMNAYVAVGVPGEVQVVTKRGLTPSEARFFSPGSVSGVLRVNGCAVGVVFCREVEDADAVVADLQGNVEMLAWPGYVAWTGADGDYVALAQDLARRLAVPLVQSNWPGALNTPDVRDMGASVVIDATGEVRDRGPRDAAGMIVARW